jgi:carbon dioxide concentrating mechanism protein CcmL
MRIGNVIGRVTLSQTIPGIQGARWLIVSPMNRETLQKLPADPGMSNDYSTVIYDDLGAGTGDLVGFIEGREAASPFDPPIPIDAITGAIIDHINYKPLL